MINWLFVHRIHLVLVKRPRATRGISWSVGSLISQAWSPNPPQMAPDGQIKQLTGMADGSHLLMHCYWWQSHTFLTRLVRGFTGLQIQRLNL